MIILLTILFQNLFSRVGLIMLLAFVMTRIEIFRRLIVKKNTSTRDKVILSIIFGIYGIIGTYTGIPIRGAIANGRVIGVFVGGLLGGPFVGFLSGLIAGGHRFLIDIGGFTAFSCGLATFTEAIAAGFLKEKIDKRENRWAFALITGMLAEAWQMILILTLSRPFDAALELVRIIGIPMIIANGIGIAVCISIIYGVSKDLETAEAFQAQLALQIANKTLIHFRKGLNEETSYEVAKIIKSMTKFDAIAFTNRERILTHIGLGEGHHVVGLPVRTNLTRKVLSKGECVIANIREEIGCDADQCPLASAIIIPLMEGDKVIGTLKLYKGKENDINRTETELAMGLGHLFSTQIELSKIDYQRELLAKAELKALQSQINPHFLFNTMNTVISLTRTQPNKARKVLVHLCNYLRNNLQGTSEVVDLNKELETIKSYLEIEKARFGDKLEIIYNIPEEIKCSLPPLLLQPIVENAVKHGIFEKLEGGYVKISAINKGKDVELIVEDNGVGMSEKTLSYLFSNKDNKNKDNKSIGLKNVNNRLKSKYGPGYGLNIESKLGQGTKVSMRIPKEVD